ncbi:hypothetical protein D3C72_2571910 [compost metagenome]
MRSIRIGVGHDDDLGIIAVLYGEFRSNSCADSRNNSPVLIILKYVSELGLLRIHRLAL